MAKNLAPKKLMHILCEGSKTEPNYISSYIDMFAPDKAKIIRVPPTKKNTPVQLVDEAVSLKKSTLTSGEDVFWVVYDRESVAKYPHALHAKARDKARANNINIAFSNICFELWVLLHFELDCAPYSSCDDILRRSNLKQHLLKVGMNNYEKGNKDLFKRIYKGIPNARKRSLELNRSSKECSMNDINKPYLFNSYTDIYMLLDAIDSFTP